MLLTDIQAVALRSQYLVRVTLDTTFGPYNTWSAEAGETAQDLMRQMAYWLTWPRCGFFIEQPIGFFIPADEADLQTLCYLMYKNLGWGKLNTWDAGSNPADYPPVTVVPPYIGLQSDIKTVITPTFGVNEPSFLVCTENGTPICCDNFAPLPAYRDWIALGLGPPPNPPGAVDPYANIPNAWNGQPG